MNKTVGTLQLRRVIVIGLILSMGTPRANFADSGDAIDLSRAMKVKAAFLFNFARLIDWPDGTFDDEESPLRIGIYGDAALAKVVARTVKGKTIRGRSVHAVRIVERSNAPSEWDCQMLYFGDLSDSEQSDVLEVVEGEPVVLVSDASQFASRGGMIGFVLEEGKIAFEINRKNVERAGLKASAKLLTLARLVENDE